MQLNFFICDTDPNDFVLESSINYLHNDKQGFGAKGIISQFIARNEILFLFLSLSCVTK